MEGTVTVQMEPKAAPLVSIGLPVYNGENFIQAAIESILAQTFEDFELIISDNASTDKTQEICLRYVARDPRVHYYRSEENMGASWNYNRVFELSRGAYFKWSAHDDVCAPDFLKKCVEVMEKDPSVVLCFPQTKIIDAQGEIVGNSDFKLDTDSESPSKRFASLILARGHKCFEAFALNRREAIEGTRLMGNYPVSDRVFLGEMALRGRFFMVPEYLFFNRCHSTQSVTIPTLQQRAQWFDTKMKGRIVFPDWRVFAEYWRAIGLAPINRREKIRCYWHMLKWLRHYRKRMRNDVIVAIKQFFSR